jgi:integrase
LNAPSSAVRQRKTKRKLLALLPPEWRSQFISGIKSEIPAMREAFVLLAITGCRPCEVAAASIDYTTDGNLVIRILSAKRRAHQLGDWREIRQPLPKRYGDCSGLVDATVLEQLRRITPQQIADVARKTSRRVFPALGEQVTASVFRHQFCSDLKSQGCTRREIAMALGHSMIESQSGYGRPRFGFVEHIKVEICASYEPSEPNSDESKTFLDISFGNDLPEP